MSYSGVNLISQYTPPVLASLASPQTVFEYDAERNLKKVTRPDGLVLDYAYESWSGRLQATSSATGSITRSYDAGHLSNLTASADNVAIAYEHAGPLTTRQQWGGSVFGILGTAYDNDFRPVTETVVGFGVIRVYYGYDKDGFLTCASPTSCSPASTDSLSLSHDPNNDLLNATQLGIVSTVLTYNAFG